MGALPWFSRVLSCLPFRGRRLPRDLFLDVLMLSSHSVIKKKKKLSGDFKVNQKSLHRQTNDDDAEALKKFGGRSKVTSLNVITLNLKFNSMCRKKKHFRIPLKYIDVTRATYTNLDIMQEKRIDDYWNLDSNRSYSECSESSLF